jgi:glyceraldehyde-3-phosphate dehydrogenase/erythrose-4-phosphate dehydrogenase
MNKLRVGIAGYGVVGKRRKDCIDLHPNMEMIAICDQFFKKGGSF